MLRVVLLVLYLIASSLAAPQTTHGGGADPLGIRQPPTPTADAGGGYDPNG
jgi:hypothetical protein